MLNEFKKFLVELNNIPHINYGGCAIAALAMHKYAKKLGMDSEIWYMYRGSDVFKNNKEALLGKADPRPCGHAICMVDGNPYDTTGFVTIRQWKYKHAVSEKFVRLSIKTGIGWNSQFEMHKWIPVIEKKLGHKLL